MIVIERPPEQHGMQGNRIGDLEKRMVVQCTSFDEFFKKYHEVFPNTDRSPDNLYSMYGKRYLYRKLFTVTLAIPKEKQKILEPVVRPVGEEKDTVTLLVELKHQMSELIEINKEILQTSRDRLQIGKETYELFLHLKKKN